MTVYLPSATRSNIKLIFTLYFCRTSEKDTRLCRKVKRAVKSAAEEQLQCKYGKIIIYTGHRMLPAITSLYLNAH